MGNLFSRKKKANNTPNIPPPDNTKYTEVVIPDPTPRPLPNIPDNNAVKVKALYDFTAINEDDISFKKGDIMTVDEATAETDDWWLVTHVKNKKKGYVPSNYVTKCDDSIKSQAWWFDVDRNEAIKILLYPGNKDGVFLIRPSKETPLALSLRYTSTDTGEPRVSHYRIRKKDDDSGWFISDKRIFNTPMDLVENYKKNADGLSCGLTKPCPRSPPAVAFREFEINRNAIKLTSKLGAGFFGEVWKGILRKSVPVAVKTMKPDTMSKEAFLEEAKILHKVSHPKLVQLMAVVTEDEPVWIITELMVNGALLDYLRSDRGKKLTFSDITIMDAQIAEGMSYLENQNLVHRDLRAANILVGENLVVKVADFGLARVLKDDQVYMCSENAKFPVKWTAPEATSEQQFTVKSDVWSFGVLMYEVATFGATPYEGLNGNATIAFVATGQRLAKPTNPYLEIPEEYYEIMLKCWKTKPEERPTFETLNDQLSAFYICAENQYDEREKNSRP